MRAGLASLRSGRGMLSAPSLSLVDGALDPARDLRGTAGHLTLTLPAALTGALLTRVPAAFHGGINDVLLTGLVVAVADWCRRRGRGARPVRCWLIWRATGARRFLRTSTSRARWAGSPACSRCGSIPARSISTRRWRAVPALGRALKLIKEQLRALPDHGLGYGLLRYLNRADGRAACGLCGAADRLQLSGALRGCGGDGLGRGCRGGAAWRRRSGHAAGARARGQCAHARCGRWRHADAPPGRGRPRW